MDIARINNSDNISLVPRMLNRHGLICGSTGSGKTITLQKLSELMIESGTSVIIPDIKGDLNCFGEVGGNNKSINNAIIELGHEVKDYCRSYNHKRLTIGESIDSNINNISSIILARMMNLTDPQFRAMGLLLAEVTDRGVTTIHEFRDFLFEYKWIPEKDRRVQVNTTTLNVLLQKIDFMLIGRVGEMFDSDCKLKIDDPTIFTINCTDLICDSAAYANYLLALMEQIYSSCDEAGDLDKPRVCLILDEAHLIFKSVDAYSRRVVTERVRHMVKTSRSRGIGVFFVTQNPLDIDREVSDQLGMRVQHTMRQGTGMDLLYRIAKGFGTVDHKSLAGEIKELGIGEAIISILDKNGKSEPAVQAKILPPRSHIGSIKEEIIEVNIEISPQPYKINTIQNKQTNKSCLLVIIVIVIILLLMSLLLFFELFIW